MDKKFDVARVDYYRQYKKVCSLLVPLKYAGIFQLKAVCCLLKFDGCIVSNVTEDLLDFLNNMRINGKVYDSNNR